MRRAMVKVAAALALLFAPLAVAQGIVGQSAGRVVIHVAVEETVPVRGPLQVVPWKLVTRLSRDDFDVSIDGQPCAVTSFSSADTSVAVVVLLDVSASTEMYPDRLLQPLQKFLLRALKPADAVAFGRFGGTALRVDDRVTDVPQEIERRARDLMTGRQREMKDAAAGRAEVPVSEATARIVLDRSTLVVGMNGAYGLGASPAWDAVDEAVSVLEKHSSRRAIILVTDGRSTGNVHSLDEAIDRAIGAHVAVSVVGEARADVIRLPGGTETRVQPEIFLRRLAETTGGAYADVFGPEPGRPLGLDDAERWVGRVLAQFIDDLHKTYALGFVPPILDGQVHRLDVRVKEPGLKVRAPQAFRVDR